MRQWFCAADAGILVPRRAPPGPGWRRTLDTWSWRLSGGLTATAIRPKSITAARTQGDRGADNDRVTPWGDSGCGGPRRRIGQADDFELLPSPFLRMLRPAFTGGTPRSEQPSGVSTTATLRQWSDACNQRK